MSIGVSKISDTLIINVVKESRRPSSRKRKSYKDATLIFNLIKVDDIQPDGRIGTGVRHLRVRNISQKFKTVNFLHKDKINSKIFDTVFDHSLFLVLMSILRCVICLARRSRRIKLSSIKKTKYKYED